MEAIISFVDAYRDDRRSNSVLAKHARLAKDLVGLALFSVLSLQRFDWRQYSVVRPGLHPLSMSAFLIHSLSVCAVQSILAAIITIAQHDLLSFGIPRHIAKRPVSVVAGLFRHIENAFGDDVLLNLIGAARDRDGRRRH